MNSRSLPVAALLILSVCILLGSAQKRGVVEGTAFRLYDTSGTLRGEFKTGEENGTTLTIRDAKGNARLMAEYDDSHELAGFSVLDPGNKIRAVIGLAEGDPLISLRDKNGQPRVAVEIRTNSHGVAGLWLVDETNKERAALYGTMEGPCGLGLFSDKGELLREFTESDEETAAAPPENDGAAKNKQEAAPNERP